MAFKTFGTGHGQMQTQAEINTTPLVDVMLVLLVIFLITAPLLHQAVGIDLPKVSASRLEEGPKTIQLALDGQGRLFWNGSAIDRATLSSRLAAASAGQPELQLQADRATRYEVLAEIMALAQRAGVSQISFVTLPTKL